MKRRLALITVSCCPLKNYYTSTSYYHNYQASAKRQSGNLWAIKGTSDLSESPKM